MIYKVDDRVWVVLVEKQLHNMVIGKVVAVDETNKTYDIKINNNFCMCNVNEIDIINKVIAEASGDKNGKRTI